MNRLKHGFYRLSLLLSGGCLVAMTLLILAQIIARLLGHIIPSSEDFASWLLCATVFFGLAYTFEQGGHIRVTLLLGRLSESARKRFETFNIVFAVLICGYLMYYCGYTVYEAYDFEDVTDTYLAMPLWLVQLPMAVGALFLWLAVLDSCYLALTGRAPSYLAKEAELAEEGEA